MRGRHGQHEGERLLRMESRMCSSSYLIESSLQSQVFIVHSWQEGRVVKVRGFGEKRSLLEFSYIPELPYV